MTKYLSSVKLKESSEQLLHNTICNNIKKLIKTIKTISYS